MIVRQVFLLDLRDVALAERYAAHHRPGQVPGRVLADIRASGVTMMEIYRSGERLIMLTEAEEGMRPGDRTISAATRDWEVLMDRFQKPLPWAEPGVKWQPATGIFRLSDHPMQDEPS